MATQKQIDANRRNAARSTGPKTDKGKKQSRRNALKHGLAGSGLILPADDAEAVNERIAEWHSSLKPFDPYEVWMLEVIAVESIRVDRCRIQDRVLRDEQMHQTGSSRHENQRQSAAKLASKLAKDPSVAARLASTIPGATLLLDRWKSLARVLDEGDWSVAQDSLALDLLGTPIALREGAASPLHVGIHGDDRAHRKAITRREIARLEQLISQVLPEQEASKLDLRKAGLPDLGDPDLVRLHRYESRCFRRLMWATQQMQSKHRMIMSSTDRVPEPSYHRPLRDMRPAPEIVVKSEPVRPPVDSPEPAVYRRPLLQHVLSEQDVKFLLNEADKKAGTKTSKPASRKPIRKNLPSPKNRPSCRAGNLTSTG